MEIIQDVAVVAFDMDGLMFDTESVYWKAASILLGRRGFRYTQEICDEIMGRPPEYCFQRFIEIFSLPEDWRSLQKESEDIFIETLKEGYATTLGLLELLDELDKRNVPKCVCTSSAKRVVQEVLKKDSIGERFDFILTSNDIQNGKPHPEIYLKAANRFQVSPSRMLVLEDSSAGSLSAYNAGAPCCMLKASHNFNADFSKASLVVQRLDDQRLLNLFSK